MPKRTHTFPITLGEKRRLDLGLTRQQLANMAGVSYSTISAAERRYKCPCDETIFALAPILGVNGGELRDDYSHDRGTSGPESELVAEAA